jgi:hypothetical protein
VRATGLLDTGPEDPFDDLARLAAAVTGCRRALITLVDERRSFWKSCIGVNAADAAPARPAVSIDRSPTQACPPGSGPAIACPLAVSRPGSGIGTGTRTSTSALHSTRRHRTMTAPPNNAPPSRRNRRRDVVAISLLRSVGSVIVRPPLESGHPIE